MENTYNAEQGDITRIKVEDTVVEEPVVEVNPTPVEQTSIDSIQE